MSKDKFFLKKPHTDEKVWFQGSYDESKKDYLDWSNKNPNREAGSGFFQWCIDIYPIVTEKSKREITFATRLLAFVKDVEPQCTAGWEEKQYIIRRAQEMLDEQRANATDPSEIDYLKRTAR